MADRVFEEDLAVLVKVGVGEGSATDADEAEVGAKADWVSAMRFSLSTSALALSFSRSLLAWSF